MLLALLTLVAGWRLVGMPSSTDPEGRGALTGSPSSRTTVSIGDEGELHVVMNLVFEAAQDEVTLRVVPPTGAGFDFDPSVELLGLDADGRPQAMDGTLNAGDAVSVSLDPAAGQVRLEYAASGTYVASELSPPGRGLVLLTPLTVLESDIPSLLEVTDARVLNLGCTDSAQTRACGRRSGDSWTADRSTSEDVVVAQLDLLRTEG